MKLSIVICNYNYAKFLNDAIESAYGVNYGNKEIIVVDDGSTDHSREILKGWESKVRVIYQANAGQVSAYNTGFCAATGDLIIFLDSDDALDANLFEIVSPHFEDDRVVKVHYKMRLIDEEGKPTGVTIPSNMSDGYVKYFLVDSGWLYFSSPGSGNIYRKKILDKLFPLPLFDDDKHGADFYCIYGIGLFGKVKKIDEPLASYRVHKQSEINQQQNNLLVFGNASKKTDELTRFRARCDRFINWVANRTNNQINIQVILTDFSIVKQAFARCIFEDKSYIGGLIAGVKILPLIFNSIYIRQQFSVRKKIILYIWTLMVLILPRKIGFPIAVKVANPAAR